MMVLDEKSEDQSYNLSSGEHEYYIVEGFIIIHHSDLLF